MIELTGKYAAAKVYTDLIDEASISQIIELCNQEFVTGSIIRLMPDVHAGAGCTIGTTMTLSNKVVVPNLVGVDIGCGMETCQISESSIDFSKLDELIYSKIPSGFNIHNTPHQYASQIDLNQLYCAKHVDLLKAEKSIGSLGGGNHFIEVDKDDDGHLYVIIHSGSRHLGLEVATFYQNAGYAALNGNDKESIAALVAEMKAQGKQSQIQNEINRLKNLKQTHVPKQLAYVSSDLFDQYIHDMKLIQQFAVLNRQAMMDIIINGLGLTVQDQFTTIHNYIDTDAMILRKGAVSAKLGEKLLIPINMRDGSLICIGKGNSDWNFSAPHGAGRIMSRSVARQTLTVEEFKRQMEGIYTTSVGLDTLDESPMAYKGMESIVENIEPTASIEKIIKPVYNFKAGG